MFDSIRNLFSAQLDAARTVDGDDAEPACRLAAAALLLEVMHADHDVTAAETEHLRTALAATFELDDTALDELLALAVSEREAAVCLYGFTRDINDAFDPQRKAHLVELMWRVANADGELDSHEQHLVRKVADLLYVPHSEFIRAKLRATGELPDG